MAPFTFRETDVPEALRVELRDDDAPYGRPQEVAAFETGGEAVFKRVKLPGRRAPLYHALHVDDRPLVVRGGFRDYRMGAGHAKAMRRLIERVRGRACVLRITWGGEQWKGVLRETLFGHEGEGHESYELTFDIALPPGTSDAPGAAAAPGDADAVARTLAQLRARPAPPAYAAGFLGGIAPGLASLEEGMASLEDTVRSVDVARGNVMRQVRRVTSLNAQVQQVTQRVTAVVRTTGADAAGVVGAAADAVQWTTYATRLMELLRACRVTSRRAATAARARVNETSRLYRVRPLDTLESIAREQLGDVGRAGELGVEARALTPGRILRLPPAASRS